MKVLNGFSARSISVFLFLMSQLAVAKVFDTEAILSSRGLGKASAEARAAAIEQLVSLMKPGDCLSLPRTLSLAKLDLSEIPNNTQIEFGQVDEIYLGDGVKEGLTFIDVRAKISGLSKTSGKLGTVRNSQFHGIAALGNGNYENTNWTEIEGPKNQAAINISGGTLINCQAFYIRYEGDRSPNGYLVNIVLKSGSDCKNTRFYQIVEHNYCDAKIDCYFENVSGGFFWGPGDTERARPEVATYVFKNCSDMVLFGHRMFSGSRGSSCPNQPTGSSYLVQGGSRLKMVSSYDIGQPKDISMRIVGTHTGLQLWNSWFEDGMQYGTDPVIVLSTANAMTNVTANWSEPTAVDSETIYSANGYTINGFDKQWSAPDQSKSWPIPPRIPGLSIGALPKHRLPKVSKSWGSKLLEAGADPTGKKSSSAAFALAMRTERILEIPKGTFLISEPLVLGGNNICEGIHGAGSELSTIKATGNFPIMKGAPLARTRASSHSGTPAKGATFDGGTYGIYENCYKCILSPGTAIYDVTFKNQTIDGIHATDGHEFDQVRLYNCKFLNIKRYGIYLGNSMTDKAGYHRCLFKDIGKAGIHQRNSMMFAGTIAQCTFENINGPAIDMYPTACPDGANPQHCSAVISCKITNCGSAERAALDWGFNENGGIVDTDIRITDGRTIKYGFAGTGPWFDRCSLFVDNGTVGTAAFGLRQTRLLRNCRPSGSTVRECYASKGKLSFLYNDVPDFATTTGNAFALLETAGGGYGTQWWKAADPSESLYPWAYGHLVFNSKFEDQSIGYVLFRCRKNGNVADQVVFSGTPVQLTHLDLSGRIPALQSDVQVFNLQGRLVQRKHAQTHAMQSRNLRQGLYLVKEESRTSQKVKRTVYVQ